MDITTLIKQYFNKQSADQVTIDIFDRTTIDVVYRRVIEFNSKDISISNWAFFKRWLTVYMKY
jgi:hypothetical protein